MSKIDWRVKRRHYSFGLGILVAIAAKLNFPIGALVGFGLFALLTAMRFKTLGWKVECAFIPLAIAVSGALIGAFLNGHSLAGAWIAKHSHVVALWAQISISLRAGISHAPGDPISPKVALARDLRAKRRQLLTTLKETKPLHEVHQREVAKLVALNAERQAHVAAHGYVMTEEHAALVARFDAQKAVVEPLGAKAMAEAERTRAQTTELQAAVWAWKDRNKRNAA